MTKIKSKPALKTEQYSVKNALVNYYLLLMFSVFPLFFTDRFVNIRHDKYHFFMILSAVLTAATLVTLAFNRFDLSGFKKFSVTDISFAALIIVFSVSTLLSDCVFDSFTGEQGRNSGLLLFIAFFIVYAVISRNFYFKNYVFAVFAISCVIVYALCIVNRFGADPLGMYDGLAAYVREDFVSTIGNRNIMSCFCCLTVPLFFVFFINFKSSVRFLYLSASVSGIAAMVFSDSLSGYLGLVPTFALIALYCLKKSEKPYSKIVFWILLVLFAAAVIVCAALFVYFTFFDTSTKLKGLMKLFRFNKKWGTHRGYMWMKTVEIFKGFGFKSVLFGCGPDTYYSVFQPYFEELHKSFGDISTNAAHNEFLNYLVTTGVLGLASYIALFASVIVRAFKTAKNNPAVMAFLCAVLCYLIQSTVNIATPITTPILFIYLAILENYSRKELKASA